MSWFWLNDLEFIQSMGMLKVILLLTEKIESSVKADQSTGGQKEDLELPFFDLPTIAKATNNFSMDNKIGEGGFGAVYKVMHTLTR